MSVARFVDSMKKALGAGRGKNDPLREGLVSIADGLKESSDRLEKRSKRIKEDRELGGRITRHRISL
ncbi:hypothetical protein AA0616_3304 [Komagataeibacter nataicola NRIC 0616]|nr:hypothetical protein AA0616_3304 [Komagataeibacter nataicola NRIC 0616]